MSGGIGCRCSSDLQLLWLWCKLAATAPIRLLAWELPYATGVALNRQKKERKEGRKKGRVLLEVRLWEGRFQPK